MLKTLLVAAVVSAISTPKAIAPTPLCYLLTATGQLVNLNSICGSGEGAELAPITATNLSLQLPDPEYLTSATVRATITNRSHKPVKVTVVQLEVKNRSTLLTTVPIFMNETLSPGQSVPASGLFNQNQLQGVDTSKLSVSFQGWH